MIGKKHNLSEGRFIFACCDADLLGKKVNFNDTVIDITEKFYGSKKITEKEFLETLERAESINVFGDKVCKLLLKNKLITKDQIVYINKIPHIQIYNI
jgi:hypothetical protein